jgi:methionyl aminopeptidase
MIQDIISIKKWERKMFTLVEAEKIQNMTINNDHLNEKKVSNMYDCYDDDRLEMIYDLRRAAECHKIVRRKIQDFIKPGVKILDVCKKIEKDIVEVFGRNDLKAGIAFPTGVCINNVIAHDTANTNDIRVVEMNDICKIDIGCHINGHIIDSAFSVTFNPEYNNLLQASREATMTAIKMCRPDASIYDISKTIKEIIESYEVVINGKNHRIKPIKDLGSHSIDTYNIHSGELILCSPYESHEYKNSRIKSDQQYAIETFASTGSGKMRKSLSRQSNHYMLNKDNTTHYKGKLKTINNVYNWIKKKRSTLPFCPRWLEDEQIKGVNLSLNEFSRKCNPPILVEYPPLEDISGSYVSHYEHTIYVSENGTEILSHGDDY